MKINNLAGVKFGRLTAIGIAFRKNGAIHWQCKCDCGNEPAVRGRDLTSGDTRSCGCLRRDVAREMSIRKYRKRLFRYTDEATEFLNDN